MRLVASEDFGYNGCSLKVGDSFEAASESDADILILIGRARPPQTAPSEPFAYVAKRGRGRPRKYERRDMVAS